jgi:hypothetical protein
MTELRVHPVAALFPMMSDAELEDLAADIKVNGLVLPITLGDWKENGEDITGGIIDGRNRLRACQIAEVDPKFTQFTGPDLVGFINACNLSRRNLSVGQMAMIIAQERRLVLSEPTKPGPQGGRPRKYATSQEEAVRIAGINHGRVSEAETIIDFAPEMVDEVKANRTPLDTAYQSAKARKQAKEWREQGMTKLRQTAPDFAERVDRGEITFEEARTLLVERDRTEEQVRQTVFHLLSDCARVVDGITSTPRIDELPEWLKVEEYEAAFREYFKGGAADLDAVIGKARSAVDTLTALNARLSVKTRRRRRDG